jgi:hypothetical protein
VPWQQFALNAPACQVKLRKEIDGVWFIFVGPRNIFLGMIDVLIIRFFLHYWVSKIYILPFGEDYGAGTAKFPKAKQKGWILNPNSAIARRAHHKYLQINNLFDCDKMNRAMARNRFEMPDLILR